MSKSSAARVEKYRANKRAAGLKQIQLWVPNTKDPKFREQCRKQSLYLNKANEKEILNWIGDNHDDKDWV